MDKALQQIFLHLYCMVRFIPLHFEGWAKGRRLEQLFSDYCITHSVGSWQGPYSYQLFGIAPASGLTYEIDGGISRANWCLLLELKAYKDFVPRDQVMVFNQKSLDFYFSFVTNSRSQDFYRCFMADSPLSASVRRFCYLWRINAIAPDLLPLPVLMQVIRSERGQEYFASSVLGEAERVLGTLSEPLNSLLSVHDPKIAITLPVNKIASPELLDDAIDMHESLSQEVLEILEEEDPELLETITSNVMRKMGRKWYLRSALKK